MTTSTLTRKNQTTIPKVIVAALGLRPSDQLVYEIDESGRVMLTAKTGTFASVAASLPRRQTPASGIPAEEIKAAVQRKARERFLRSKP